MPHDLPSIGSERQAEADFLGAPGAANQEQVGDVGAGNQQNDAGQAEQGVEKRTQELAGAGFTEWPNPGQGRRRLAERLRHSAARVLERGPGLLEGHSLGGSGHALEPLPAVDRQRGVARIEHRPGRDGHPGIERHASHGAAELGGNDADHREAVAVDGDLSSEHAGIALKPAGPVALGEDHHLGRLPFVLHRERPPGQGPDAEKVEVVPRHHVPPEPLRDRSFGSKAERLRPVERDVNGPGRGLPPLTETGIGERPLGATRSAREHGDQPIRLGHGGERVEDEGIGPMVRGGRGPDPEPERQHHHRRETGRPQQAPEGDPQISHGTSTSRL